MSTKLVPLAALVAMETATKSKATQEITALHRLNTPANAERYKGTARRYQKTHEEGEQLPDENKVVELRTDENIERACRIWEDLFDVTYSKETGNCSAIVDLVVDGKTLIPTCPVSWLIQLQNKLNDIETFFSAIPTLALNREWTWDSATRFFTSGPDVTLRTAKIESWVTVVAATEQHPAQVQKKVTDVVVGKWETLHLCSGIEPSTREAFVERIRVLKRAVTLAIQTANAKDVEHKKVNQALFAYILGV